MIAYFDTSSVVPLIINEASTELCTRVWNESSRIATMLADSDLVLVTGDSDLAAAAVAIELAVSNTNA